MKPEIRAAIEAQYGLTLRKCVPGPRQFVSATYILTDVQDRSYFCKCVDKPLFIPDIIKSLPVVEAIYGKGLHQIACPLRAAGELYLFVEDTLVVLFNYIAARQSYDYSPYVLGQLIARVHAITACISVDVPKEDFEVANRLEFETKFQGILMAGSDADPVIRSAQAVLRRQEAEIRSYYAEYLRLSNVCKAEACDFVITHGDAPGNVLVSSSEDIYLIDWDHVLLAPPERDMWIMDHFPKFLDGYESVRRHYVANASIRSFFIYKYYFDAMMYYFAEILGPFDRDYRSHQARELESNLLKGWMLPKLREI